ncbi:MAG TPA: GGDEF domain-containing protein [Methylomirabilota bacterium]|nr:GGDEF domain-containing protein [Methylomirabilota bacterium]
MGVEWLFEPRTEMYKPDLFGHLFSLETTRALRYREVFSVFVIELDCLGDPLKPTEASTEPARNERFAELTRLVSHNLRSELRKTDCIGRLGQEIAIIAFHAGEEEIPAIADRIQRRIENFAFPSHRSESLSKVTISIGVACFPRNGNNDSSLLLNARLGLEEAKRGGGNRYAIARSSVRTSRIDGSSPERKEGDQ